MTLKRLYIQNIVLIDQAVIPFERGFNVLSGETGSGKSALISGLHFIAGERADTQMIRRGAEKGSVEAHFEIEQLAHLHILLDEAGIEHEEGTELILKRELLSSGKSRAFVNNQGVQLALLKQLGEHLIEMVGQHANQRLLNLDQHRILLDLYAGLEEDVAAFAKQFAEENELRKQLETLLGSEAHRLRELEVCRMELEELDQAALKEGEDEELFQEYTLLVNAEERTAKTHEIHTALNQERGGILGVLKKQRSSFEQLAKMDAALEESRATFEAVLVELQEVGWTLDRYIGQIEHNPERLTSVDERLGLINKLKRKYGNTFVEIEAYRKKRKAQLIELEGADDQIEVLRAALQKKELMNQIAAVALTQARQKAALPFAAAVMQELASLNMAKAEFHIEITPQKRTRTGDDRIEFYLAPNVGERRMPVREAASGGELSRLMLALQTLLAGKTQIPTLVFDEIDANIGGATATIIGAKMSHISKNHQILCVTHFPQVAKEAHHHLQISKREIDGRTVTQVIVLNPTLRAQELARMQG